MLSNLSKILNDVNTFVVPARCFGCNATLYRGEQLLCAFCRNELPLTEYNFMEENSADRIFYGRSRIVKAGAFLYYIEKGVVQQLLHGLKYRGQERVGSFLGAWYGQQLSREPLLKGIDYVLPVPLHRKKERRRGYNQCSRFGQEIARCLGARYSEKFLIREIPTPSQTGRERWGRWQNASGAFRLRQPGLLEHRRILLVDDVITTGATLESCCEALWAHSNVQVFIAVMAVVP
jgi:ComF family protein